MGSRIQVEFIRTTMPHHEELIVEVWVERRIWAEVSKDHTEMMVTFYPNDREHPDGPFQGRDDWHLPYIDAMAWLAHAADLLDGTPSSTRGDEPEQPGEG